MIRVSFPKTPGRVLGGLRPTPRGVHRAPRTMAPPRARGEFYVPSDSFGGRSPERMASLHLRKLFTFCAARIILAQLEGSGRGALGSFNATQYQHLSDHLINCPMTDPEEWLTELMKTDQALAVRIIDVRSAYCEDGFEWDTLQRIADEEMHETNARLMKHHVETNFKVFSLEEERELPGRADFNLSGSGLGGLSTDDASEALD